MRQHRRGSRTTQHYSISFLPPVQRRHHPFLLLPLSSPNNEKTTMPTGRWRPTIERYFLVFLLFSMKIIVRWKERKNDRRKINMLEQGLLKLDMDFFSSRRGYECQINNVEIGATLATSTLIGMGWFVQTWINNARNGTYAIFRLELIIQQNEINWLSTHYWHSNYSSLSLSIPFSLSSFVG